MQLIEPHTGRISGGPIIGAPRGQIELYGAKQTKAVAANSLKMMSALYEQANAR